MKFHFRKKKLRIFNKYFSTLDKKHDKAWNNNHKKEDKKENKVEVYWKSQCKFLDAKTRKCFKNILYCLNKFNTLGFKELNSIPESV